VHEHALRRDVFASFICRRRMDGVPTERSVRLQPDRDTPYFTTFRVTSTLIISPLIGSAAVVS
jgi:hypothetical protein